MQANQSARTDVFNICHIYIVKLSCLSWFEGMDSQKYVLLDFSLTVKAATLIFISGCGSAISSAKEGKSDFIYNLVNS